MYSDPSHRRTRVTKLRFSAEEMRLIRAAAEKAHMQPAVYVRNRLLNIASRIVSGGICQDKETLFPAGDNTQKAA